MILIKKLFLELQQFFVLFRGAAIYIDSVLLGTSFVVKTIPGILDISRAQAIIYLAVHKYSIISTLLSSKAKSVSIQYNFL